MADKDKQAYWKGINDAQKPDPGAVTKILGGQTYKPPSGQKEAYKAGWDRGKSEKK